MIFNARKWETGFGISGGLEERNEKVEWPRGASYQMRPHLLIPVPKKGLFGNVIFKKAIRKAGEKYYCSITKILTVVYVGLFFNHSCNQSLLFKILI